MFNPGEEDYSPEVQEEMKRWPWQFRLGIILVCLAILLLLMYLVG